MNIQEHALLKLKCTRCHLYLSVGPITSNPNGNFLCGRCPSGSTQVKIYEALAEHFVFPCRYQSFGCDEVLKWDSVQCHEQKCIKKPHLCPVVPTGICLWRGAINDIKNHFKQTHTEDVTDMNLIDIKLHENIEGCKLIENDKKCYIFHVYFSRAQKLLKLNVMQLNDTKSFHPQKYQLTLHAYDFSKHITLAADVLEPYDTMDHNNIKDKNIIDISVLKFLTNDNPAVFCEINFNLDKNKVTTELFKLLECPVCNECMGTPIYQCQAGHSFCNTCISKLKDCPMCHKVLSETRNYALEDLVNQMSHHCKNKEFGCTSHGLLDDVRKHEQTCNLYKCPLRNSQNCTWGGDFQDLIVHCKTNHVYLETENYGLLCSLTVDKFTVFRLIYSDGMFFRICRKYENEEFCVVIQFVGPTDKAADYSYEFSFVDVTNDNKQVAIKDFCQEFTDDEKAFDNCFKIPYSVLKMFEKNNKLKCNVKIIKKDQEIVV